MRGLAAVVNPQVTAMQVPAAARSPALLVRCSMFTFRAPPDTPKTGTQLTGSRRFASDADVIIIAIN